MPDTVPCFGLQGPRTLSASVTVAEDIPVLRAFEAASAEHGGNTELRAYRLDTVEDDEAMTSSLPLPTSPGDTSLKNIGVPWVLPGIFASLSMTLARCASRDCLQLNFLH